MATRTKSESSAAATSARRTYPAGKKFENLDVVACADIDLARAQAAAKEHGIARACSVDELLATPDIEIVVNLTIPKAHAAVDLAVLSAGKHVYSEKPLALSRKGGADLVARELQGPSRGQRARHVSRSGHPACLKAVADGLIGEPVAATAFVTGHGHESLDPISPYSFYQAGGGPLFDMGPYYLTALVAFLGRARRMTASTKAKFAERMITSRRRTAKRSKSKSPRTTPASSISTAEPLPRCSRASTCGAPSFRASRSTGPKARSACPIP